jgi:branched-chain amino acid transport system substrate-binding protein
MDGFAKTVRPFPLALLLFLCLAGTLKAQEPLMIVHLGPLSGPLGERGRSSFAGIQFASEEINGGGGLLGRKIKVLAEDTHPNSARAFERVIGILKEREAKIIFHSGETDEVRAMMKVAPPKRCLFVILKAEADSLTGKEFDPRLFRTCLTISNRSRAYVEFFKTKPWRNFFVIHESSPVPLGLAEDFKRALKERAPDFQIIGEDLHPLGERDFKPTLAKIIKAGAEVIVTDLWGADLEGLILEGARMGIKARIATYFLDDPVRLAQLGQAAVGHFVLSTYLPTAQNPQNHDFLERWHERHGGSRNPWPNAAIGEAYQGVKFLSAAIRKAQTFEAEGIIRAWEGMEYDSVGGRLIMRACDHQTLRSPFIGEVLAQSVLFSFLNPAVATMVPMDRAALSLRETGNPTCK